MAEITEGAEYPRKLTVPTGYNVRELGAYPAASGMTARRRFLRSGSTSDLDGQDAQALVDYGVHRVLDLRGSFELRSEPDELERRPDVTYLNVPLFDYDLSDPALSPQGDDGAFDGGTYLTDGYLTMLANRPAIRQMFSFFAATPHGSCVLFHCAAGMDRTGVTAMLLLGLVGVGRDHIIADYCYSFAKVRDVDRLVFEGKRSEPRQRSVLDRLLGRSGDDDGSFGSGLDRLSVRYDTIAHVYDRLIKAYGTVGDYLRACGVDDATMRRVADHLMS